MKKERSQPTPMKLEGLLETFINSYMPKTKQSGRDGGLPGNL